MKHNKKRNTAFVYEALIREATESIIKQDVNRKNKVFNIIKKHFAPGTELHKELFCYRSLYENQNLSKEISEKILHEAKLASKLLDANKIFKSQSDLIKDINIELSSDVFNNFVPNYKALATIAQIFSSKIAPKNRVMLEQHVVDRMSSLITESSDLKPIDNLTLNTFIKKFNQKYSSTLLKEQKELLSLYVSSFSDNGLELKMFLNNELGRIKDKIQEAKKISYISCQTETIKKLDTLHEKLDSYAKKPIDSDSLIVILKTQQVLQEIFSDANSN